MTQEDYQALLYEALAQPIGLVCLASPDFEHGRQRLYSARKKALDPDLDVLQIRASPWAEGNLVICKSTVKVKSNGNE